MKTSLLKKLVALTLAFNICGAAQAGLSNPGNTQIPGVPTNYVPPAGFLGEPKSTAPGLISVSNGVTTNLTSISLTPGVWLVWGAVLWKAAGTTTISTADLAVNSVSVTFPADPLSAELSGVSYGAGASPTQNTVPQIVAISTTTTYFLIGNISFAVSTCQANPAIYAIRIV